MFGVFLIGYVRTTKSPGATEGRQAVFMNQKRKASPAALVGQFTSEETDRLTQLQELFRAYPDCYTLDLNYRRLEFARWLQEHGRIGEWRDAQRDAQHDTQHDTQAEPQNGTATDRQKRAPHRQRCA